MSTTYSRSQLYLSRQLAQLHPELTMPMFSEICHRLQTARPSRVKCLLYYLVPWLYNMELVDGAAGAGAVAAAAAAAAAAANNDTSGNKASMEGSGAGGGGDQTAENEGCAANRYISTGLRCISIAEAFLDFSKKLKAI